MMEQITYDKITNRVKKAVVNNVDKLVKKYGEKEVRLVIRRYFELKKEKKSAEQKKEDLESQLSELKKEYKI